MPEASIIVKATDRYSEAVKKMASVTKSFSKDAAAPEDTDCIAWHHLLCQKNSLLTRSPVEHHRVGRYSPAL